MHVMGILVPRDPFHFSMNVTIRKYEGREKPEGAPLIGLRP